MFQRPHAQLVRETVLPLGLQLIGDGHLRRAVLAEADVAGLSPHRTGFQEVDFFRTPLKGVDFSDCALEGITVSESLGELRGMKINPAQAVDLIPLLGIQLL